jgi:hypothetical protein
MKTLQQKLKIQESLAKEDFKVAKYSRFDSRNKKRGRHKTQSQNKDIRIKNTDKTKKPYLLSPEFMVEYDYNEGENNGHKQLKQSNSY